MRFSKAILFLFLLLVISCDEDSVTVENVEVSEIRSLTYLGDWSVQHDSVNSAEVRFELLFISTAHAETELDSLHFDTVLPDSLRFNRQWNVGGGVKLVFSVIIPDTGDNQLIEEVIDVYSKASLIRPVGLRSVYLTDRTGSEIDIDRAAVAVEPPPDVTHHLLVYYQQDSTSTLLEVIDSLVVDFRGSNVDSMYFTFIRRDLSSVISSTAGVFRRGSAPNSYICFADSSGLYTGVFRNQFQINIPYLDSQGIVSVQSRLTSAYLSSDAYYPLASSPSNYVVKIFLPDSIVSWTPLAPGGTPDEWNSEPGGIVGGLLIAIGDYSEKVIFPRYRMLTFEGAPISSLDSTAVVKIASVLRSVLDFSSVEFSFVEIINPSGTLVTSAFGGMLFSRGSLESLVNVSSWDESFVNGEIPAGSEILIEAAGGILAQSLQLDPILFDMLVSWMPLRYYATYCNDHSGLVSVRKAYLKYYLYHTENLGGNESTPLSEEYAFGDLMLVNSPLRPYIAQGKGVIVLEYLRSLRMLNRLPHLLQGFTHASSGNFWLKITSSLRLFSNTEKYDLLRALLYQPGIPQIKVNWWQQQGGIQIDMMEIQPGIPFNLDFNSCQLFYEDTVYTEVLQQSDVAGILQCNSNLQYGVVNAIDLNPEGLIPADFMYYRLDSRGIE